MTDLTAICPGCREPWSTLPALHFCPPTPSTGPLNDAAGRVGLEWGEPPTSAELASAGRVWNGEPEKPQDARSVDSEAATPETAPDTHSLSPGAAGKALPLDQPAVALTGGPNDVGLLVRRLFIETLEAQERKGLAEYGRPLAAGNGRDAFADLLAEMVDSWQYAVQARMEREALERALAEARAALEDLYAQASFAFPGDADFMQRARAVLLAHEVTP